MNILQLCKKFPYPAKDGESVAVLSMSQGMAACGAHISLLAMNTSKHFVEVDRKAEELSHYNIIRTVFVENEIDPLDALINLINGKSYNIERFISESFAKQLIELLENNNFDLIQLESLYMVPYIQTIRKYTDALVVMRSHNLEFEIWNDLADKNSNPLLKWYYRICAQRLKSYEFNHIHSLDSIVFISEEDAKKYKLMGYEGRCHVSPVGFDVSKYLTANRNPVTIRKIGYIGSLDWKPNIEGVSWFLDEVWPQLHSKFPELEFHLAGRNVSSVLASRIPENVVFHGEVEDALAFIDNLDMLVVPLFSGSGIRVKILESMALSKVVLSTEKGFEGIGVEDGMNALVFHNTDDILNAIQSCLGDQNYYQKIKTEARQLIEKSFDYIALSQRLLDHYRTLLPIKV